MTAQSFAEAFTAPPLTDAADALLAAAERIKELDAQLESARRWAVALENRLNGVEGLAVESQVPGLGSGVVDAEALLRVCRGEQPNDITWASR